jgi:cation:H+ antiporter
VTDEGDESAWWEKVAAAAAATVPGLLVRMSGGAVPYPLQLVAYGTAVVAAAFMLAWACEAAQVDVAHGVVVAGVAFVAILPEYVVEVHFAFVGQAEYVTANLTGASRLLLGVCVALPAAMALLPPRWRSHAHAGPVAVDPSQRVELAVLMAASLWALRGVALGRFTLLDSAVLIGLYLVYLRRVAASGGESPEPLGLAAQLAALPRRQRRRWVAVLMGYSATVVLVTAVPFGEAVLGSGALVGVSPYVLLQWLVPVATEVPELVVAFVLLTHGRGGQSVAVLLAGAVSQYTLALGTLPIAYHLGAGIGPLPLAGRERVELLLSAGVALYAIASLITLRLSRGDAAIMLVLSVLQLLLPFVVTRLALGLGFMAIAFDVLSAERRHIRPCVGVLLGRLYRPRDLRRDERRDECPDERGSVRRRAASTSGP